MQVPPRTIQIWSDIGCPWAHAAVWRLHDARRRLGLTDAVTFEHRVFPLELFNSEPTPRQELDAEWPVIAALAPRAGWRAWSAPAEAWPATMLPPMEAVQAAAIQSPRAAEQLDRGLRRAFWGESRCISLRHVILEVANECESVDVAALAEALDSGQARRRIFDDWEIAKGDEVQGSPHVFLPDGSGVQNPGVEMRWEGDDGSGGGFPVIDRDDPGVCAELVRRAASS
jgi:predicted DsbA family dithiol-disulfide isomerase